MLLINPSYVQGYARNGTDSLCPNLWQGLVGLWVAALGMTGAKLWDVSGRQNHGLLTSMVPSSDWVATKHGWALDFDGSDDMIDCGQGSSLDITNRVSLAAWFYYRDVGAAYRQIIAKRNGANYQYSIRVHISGADHFFSFLGTGGSQDSTGTLTANNWYFLVATNGGSRGLEFYINGELISTHAAKSMATKAVNLYIAGEGTAGTHLSAIIPWAGVWNRILLASEVRRLYLDPYCLLRLKRRGLVSSSRHVTPKVNSIRLKTKVGGSLVA